MDDNATVDAMLDDIEVPAPLPTLDSALRWAFVCDVAQRSYPEEETAKRYGFTDALAMVAYIRNDKELVRAIKVRRAYWDSDVGLPEKLRTLYGHTLQYGGVANAKLMLDPFIKPEVRLEAMRQHARIAGVDGVAATARGDIGTPGARFVLQINIPGEKPVAFIEGAVTDEE